MLLYFLKNPQKTGAICSSSAKLACAMIDGVGLEKAQSIAEIGPGLGAFTREIIKKKSETSLFFVLEINGELVEKLQNKFPQLKIYHNGAEELPQILKQEQINGLDAIISGLPWSIFSSKVQDDLLDKIYNSLNDEGYFSTFAYIFPTPQAYKFRKKLFNRFASVRISRIVWKNFPPAYVYYCQK